MHLTPASRELLAALAERPWSDDFYLAGSAALALHLCHRPVRDLDLMSTGNTLASQHRRDLMEDLLRFDPKLRVETARDGYLSTRTGFGSEETGHCGLKFFYYPYPQIESHDHHAGLAVSSLMDLGLMKVGAIISRGSWRDFLDLFLICRRIPLDDLLACSNQKFPHVRDFPLQALKGLADRSTARRQPFPEMAHPDSGNTLQREEIESWFDDQVRRLGRAHVGLDWHPPETP
ncbi:MAG: nucleotidyl transferase AbiEii/AbiGii toxin family protein [Acidobacteriota bacterium]